MLYAIAVVLILAALLAFLLYNNLTYEAKEQALLNQLGFSEKQYILPDSSVINYAQGPKNGIPLLLIHGQSLAWQIFIKILPQLSQRYHVFAVDCYGHGKSSKNPQLYTIEKIANALLSFVEQVIQQPVVISGNSSGGLIAAWMAAHGPALVKGVVLEDPPLFSSEQGRCEKTEMWLDFLQTAKAFLAQKKQPVFILYYIESSKKGIFWRFIYSRIKKRLRKYPDQKLKLAFLPPAINKRLGSSYDIRFAAKCYDCSWFVNFDHAQTLSQINCPVTLIHATKWQTKKGILQGAMTPEDAQKAHELMVNSELIKVNSGHCINEEQPKTLIKIIDALVNKLPASS